MLSSLCRTSRSSRLLKSFNLTASRNILIETESTPNPNSIKFLPGKEVLPELYGSGREFQRTQHREFQCCPLAISIFEIDGINGVYLGRDFISVTKAADYQWNILKPQVGIFMGFCAARLCFMYCEPILISFFRYSQRYLTSFRRISQ
jgi:NFU1 iron-sulfur cluster scaffold homolog, mitochondrial